MQHTPRPRRTTIKYPAESFSKDEVRAILDACGTTWVGKRNRALIVVMWRGGLRLGEALALRPQDIDSGGRVRILHGKGDKARTAALDPTALAVVNEWAQVRSTPFPLLFTTKDGGELEQSYVRALMKRLQRKSGVVKRVHAHGFRHTFAVECSREGMPVRDIQQLLGHASLATTSIYLASLSPEEAINRVRGREW